MSEKTKIFHNDIEIGKLLINRENPRFNPVQDEQAAVDKMLDEMTPKLKNLAKDIAQNGLNPGELLYVVKKDEKYIVLEGNRRVTAMKLINDPQLIKNNEQTKTFFQDLKSNYEQKLPPRMRCVIFNNEKDAEHWIKLKHTGENNGIGPVSWNSIQQERFQYQRTGKKSKLLLISEFMDNNNISTKKPTIIEKLISTLYVREKIGINFKKEELVLVRGSGDEKNTVNNLKKVIEKIDATDFSPLNTVDSKNSRIKWINEVLGNGFPKETAKAEKKENNKKIKRPISSNNKNTLIPRNFTLNISQEKVKSIFEELKSLKLNNHNNAVAVLLRVFLELSVDHFIQKNKNKLNLRENQERKLKNKLKSISNYMESENILTKNELKPICKAISDQHDFSSIDTFNSYIHNLDHIPLAQDLKRTWQNYEKFIKKIWES